MVVGEGDFCYQQEEGWGSLPLYWKFGSCSDVAVDSQDRVYVLDRGTHPVTVFDRHGSFLSAWGEGLFRFAHSIYIDKENYIWTSDCYCHVVMKFTQSGELVQTFGTRGVPGTTYYGEPFNMPTGVATSPSGSVFVSDGYGNYRVQKFSPDGRHLLSWGGPGTAPGRFALVHYLDIDGKGNVYVCDRENGRVQIFDESGAYLSEWTGLQFPAKIYVKGDVAYVIEQGEELTCGRVSIFSLDGGLLSRWTDDESKETGLTGIAHGIAVDSRGDVYVAELNPNLYSNIPPRLGGKPRIGKFVHLR